MTAALTPELALAYVRELSADVLGGVVLDAAGAVLAGEPALAEPARALLAVAPAANEIHGATAAGGVFAARDAERAIVIATGRFALPGVTRHDLRTALAALGGEPAREPAPATAPPAAVSAVLAAADNAFRPHSVN